MANKQESPTMGRTMLEDTDITSGGTSGYRSPSASPRPGKGRTVEDLETPTAGTGAPRASSSGRTGMYSKGEVAGDEVMAAPAILGGETIEADQEYSNLAEATEAGEEFAEATAEQLASAETGEESAVSDLRGIEGFEEAAESGEEGVVTERPLQEAGVALAGGQEEFLPFLAALVPTLVSSIGPSVAKGVMKRLSPKAKRVIKRARPIAATAVKTAVGAAAGAVKKGSPAATVIGLISKLLESGQEGYETGMEAEEAVVAEAAAVLEVILGTDDRVRIQQTTEIPWRRICALRIHFPSGATYRGSGFLIGPRAVATAGHCVYLHNQGGWARRIEVIPGANGLAKPMGQAVATSFRSVSGWINSRKPASDYGCIVLPSGSFNGRNLGSFGFAAFTPQDLLAQAAVLAGYPGDKPFAELWGMARKIKTVTANTLIYDIDTMGGQSGAPVYIKRNGQRYVVGIHNYGASTGNSATRVTAPVAQRLLGWSQL